MRNCAGVMSVWPDIMAILGGVTEPSGDFGRTDGEDGGDVCGEEGHIASVGGLVAKLIVAVRNFRWRIGRR